MHSLYPLQTAILHFFTTITIITITTSTSAAPANPIPHLTNTTFPPTLAVWPTLPWWTKLRTPNLDPPAFLDVFSIAPHPATPQQTYILQELVLIPLAQLIHGGSGPANETEMISRGGVGAEFVPVVERAAGREVVATGVAALAVVEGRFGARGVRAGVRVGEVRVGWLVVWIGGRDGGGGVGGRWEV